MTETTPKSTPDLAAQVLALGPKIRDILSIIQTRGAFRFDLEAIKDRRGDGLELRPVNHAQRTTIDGAVVTVEAEFAVHGRFEAAPDQIVFDVSAAFSIKYELADDALPIESRALHAFGEVNAPFNLTAYWREYLHSCIVRAGLPPIEVPPFNAARAINAIRRREQAKVAS